MSATNIPLTDFAPAERVPIDIIRQQALDIEKLPLTPQVLNSVLNCVLILNPQRQIVFASENVKNYLDGKTASDIIGLRPGEAFGCLHSDAHESGCGTSRFCAECGAVKAALASLAGYSDLQECRMLRLVQGQPQALDLLVYASPLQHNGKTFSLFCLTDISHQKRRRAMERIFFHDLLNSVGSLAALMEQLSEMASDELKEDLELAQGACQDAVEQILSQKDLMAAENNELSVHPEPVNALLLLDQLVKLFARHPVANERRLMMGPCPVAVALLTDPTLLRRVLGNLIKNALEASPAGSTVTVSCMPEGERIRFSVNNPGVMPQSVQLQMFHRSFTTKGDGRGLGTYSVKLITERYLGGTVGFTSEEETGTTFFILLPRRPSFKASAD